MDSGRDTVPPAASVSRLRGGSLLQALAIIGALTSQAAAADRWEEAGGGAVAILPVPTKARVVTGGSLACAEQRWHFRLRADMAGMPSFGDEVVVTIDDVTFSARPELAAAVVSVPVPYEAIEDLKAGNRLNFAFGQDEEAPGATFSLRSSKVVLDAIALRCSQIDMTGYDRIALSETGLPVEVARPLMAEEIEFFRVATTGKPVIAAAQMDLPDTRAILFSSLCGSTWYYGRTGCTFLAFTRSSATSSWQEAYSSEGVAMYTDSKTSIGGWPNLVTLPLVGGTEATHWVWAGSGYALKDHAVAESEAQAEGQGDIAQ